MDINTSDIGQQLNNIDNKKNTYNYWEQRKTANPPLKKVSPTPSLNVELASSPEAIEAAQRLRYQIFAEEMGAEVKGHNEGLDRDHYDDYCHHLLVRDRRTQEVVGCTRILTQKNARLAGSFYSENEFDMQALQHLKGNVIEIGRTCIHADYRNGSGIAVLWSGLAQFMQLHQTDYMIGCASISMSDGGMQTRAIMQKIREKHLSPNDLRVQPLKPLPPSDNQSDETIPTSKRLHMPPLVKAYLRLGAWVAGEPCFDPDFNVADIFILLNVDNLNARYHRHFIKGATYHGAKNNTLSASSI